MRTHVTGEHRRRSPGTRIALIAVTAVSLAVALGLAVALVIASLNAPAAPRIPVALQRTTAPAVPTIKVVPEPEPVPAPAPPIAFDAASALAEARTLVSFGVRRGGTPAESDAADWLRSRMGELGYAVTVEDVPLPNGTTSHNVVARAQGASTRVVVLGAHMDTKAPSPGANDNASGCGALLEIARILAAQPVTPTVEFVFFGTEEMIAKDGNDHHYGSRYRVDAMSTAQRSNTAGMISVDMIAFGPTFHSRTMHKGPQSMSDLVLSRAAATGVKMTYLKDPGASGWSDHEPYELAGIPATWIEWRDDPVYHTKKDTMARLSAKKVRVAGQLVLDVLRSLDEAALERLVRR
jgi:aminopeptidase YwaD